jgi:hypothetical protein
MPSVTIDTDALVATVRREHEHRTHGGRTNFIQQCSTCDALDALAAELERVKDDARIWEKIARNESLTVERVKAERADVRKRMASLAEAADMYSARLDKALTALREIRDRNTGFAVDGIPWTAQHIARAAIAEIEGTDNSGAEIAQPFADEGYPPSQPTYERCVSDAWQAVDKARKKEKP